MDGIRNVVDVSSFFLFEATGDSETDSHLNLGTVDDMDVGDQDDDDAQSCSWDSSDYAPIVEYFDGFDHDDDGDLGFVKIDGGDQEDDDKDEEEVNKKDWGGDDTRSRSRSRSRSMVCVDSAREVMNEMEKNKLFWEACLAS